MIDEDLVRLIREVVKQELKVSRATLSEIGGMGGNTVISSRGDIVISPGAGRHAFYQKESGRVELGSGGSIDGSGTANKVAKFSDANTRIRGKNRQNAHRIFYTAVQTRRAKSRGGTMIEAIPEDYEIHIYGCNKLNHKFLVERR